MLTDHSVVNKALTVLLAIYLHDKKVDLIGPDITDPVPKTGHIWSQVDTPVFLHLRSRKNTQ